MAVGVFLIALVGVAVGRISIQGQSGSGSPLAPFSQGNTGSGQWNSSSADAGTIPEKVDPDVVDVVSRLGFEGGEAAGTGMVLSASGYVLTNNHVIDGATSVSVTDVGNGQTYTASVVGSDKTQDVAVLKLQGASKLTTISIGNSSTLAVGAAVTAIGNAGGVGGVPSVATGHVTNLDQAITASDESDNSSEQLTGLIQTDAALQPGDSGRSPRRLRGGRDGHGHRGFSVFQFQSGGTEGFAIPINEAVSIARQIMAGKSSSVVHIGPAALIGIVVGNSTSPAGAQIGRWSPGRPPTRPAWFRGRDHLPRRPGSQLRHLPHQPDATAPSGREGAARLGLDASGQQHTATLQLVTGPAG